jgi:GR25 family glycosyltransferase involved in LPS biosynthesis
MKAFVIVLPGNEYSEGVAARCIRTADEIGAIDVRRFHGVAKQDSEETMRRHSLKWAWTTDEIRYCPISGLRQHSYGGDLRALIGCTMSHYLLWLRCVELDEPILILEHDAVFIREFSKFDFRGICQINDPAGATRRGQFWHDAMVERGTAGVHAKTCITTPEERIPDGLAGNSAYVIKPYAAWDLIGKCDEVGLWPNDAIMCRQFCHYLEEYYPFITRVEQAVSTSK